MTMTDPMRTCSPVSATANVAMHRHVRMPSSKLKESLAEVLVAEAISRVQRETTPQTAPVVSSRFRMKYSPERARTISGVKRRVQTGSACLPWGGQACPGARRPGVAVLSPARG